MQSNGQEPASEERRTRQGDDGFETEGGPDFVHPSDSLLLNLDGYEGPIDLLLTLARDQKVDLTRISILALAEQYLEFIRRARELKLEIAADYLVMAAWLAYLKSRLLLPVQETDEDAEDPAELAARLAFQLQRLEAMQKASQELLALPKLGQDFFRRGRPERIRISNRQIYDVSLFDLLKAYGFLKSKEGGGTLRIMPTALYSMDRAIMRLRTLVGHVPDWEVLESFLPHDVSDPLVRRSAIAATFAAALELTRQGVVEIRQNGTFEPIFLKPRKREDGEPPATRTPVNDGEFDFDGE